MKKVDYDILKAQILINKVFKYDLNFDNYRYFEKIYPFTTENISSYYKYIDFKNKDVLTVGSSGDHTLNLYLEGVNSVDYFDINSFSKYYFDLKKGAIESLELDEFIDYFCLINYYNALKNNKKSFDINLYHKISPYLNDDSRYFWDNLYLDNTGYEIRNSDLFSNDEESRSVLFKVNNYLKFENYYTLKDQIINYKEPIFYNSNITDLSLNKKYDIIMLSNIAKYLEYIYKDNYLENFYNLICLLEKNLNDNGKILIAYIYDINHSSYLIKEPPIYNLEEVSKYFKSLGIFKFRGIENIKYHQQNPTKDAILIYKKTK